MEKENVDLENNDDLLETVKNLKENSVPKEDYDKLKGDYKKLMTAYAQGKELENKETKEKPKSLDELRGFLKADANVTNLEFIKGALELRKAVLEQSGEDIFVGKGHKLQITQNDYETAERVADGLQAIVDRADGDNDAFLTEYARVVKDVALPRRK